VVSRAGCYNDAGLTKGACHQATIHVVYRLGHRDALASAVGRSQGIDSFPARGTHAREPVNGSRQRSRYGRSNQPHSLSAQTDTVQFSQVKAFFRARVRGETVGRVFGVKKPLKGRNGSPTKRRSNGKQLKNQNFASNSTSDFMGECQTPKPGCQFEHIQSPLPIPEMP
jgi:hypothetical protein